MSSDYNMIDAVVVPGSLPRKCGEIVLKQMNASSGVWEDHDNSADTNAICKIQKCIDGYLGPTNDNQCVKKESCVIENAKITEQVLRRGEIVCDIDECNLNYTKKDNECVFNTKCDITPDGANESERQADGSCKIISCKPGYDPPVGNKCNRIEGECATDKLPTGASNGVRVYKNGAESCEATACTNPAYEIVNGACVAVAGDCKPDDKNATAGKRIYKNNAVVCDATACVDGYHVSGGACVYDLSEAESSAKIAELQENADEMKAKENSLANRTLGAASIGATGIGAGELLGGLAQQNADRRAENEMQALTSSFYCDDGAGHNIPYNTVDSVLPGAGALEDMYREYIDTADDLKIVKTDLGLMPGIESEIVIDRAASGLYDDVSAGRVGGGTFASLSRAILNPGGEDAAEIAAQRDAAAARIRTGAIVAGAGIIGGIAGNMAINSPNAKGNNIFGQKVDVENSREINKKYAQKLRDEMKDVPPLPEPEYVAKDSEPIVETPEEVKDNTEAVAEASQVETPTDETVDDNKNPVVSKEFEVLELSGDSLFERDSAEIKDDAKATIIEAAKKVKEFDFGDTDFVIAIIGMTDRAGSAEYNKTLSQRRADAVRQMFVDNGISRDKMVARGLGESLASQTCRNRVECADDRKVNFYLLNRSDISDARDGFNYFDDDFLVDLIRGGNIGVAAQTAFEQKKWDDALSLYQQMPDKTIGYNAFMSKAREMAGIVGTYQDPTVQDKLNKAKALQDTDEVNRLLNAN
jgi:outer membrane protein OmpA-like peptidoglycan-associated protein